MSKFAYLYDPNRMHDTLIAPLVAIMGCKKYLELGIYDGFNIARVHKHCDYCVGVDISDKRSGKGEYKFIQSTTDEFFKNNEETFDVIFIDADHSFEAVKKDFIK